MSDCDCESIHLERAELRAEVERLQERYEFQVDANRSLVEAVAKSEAENERLQSCLYAQESVPALYAEINRLRAATHGDIVEMLAENDRLTAALQKIVAMDYGGEMYHADFYPKASQIARLAIAGKEEKGS